MFTLRRRWNWFVKLVSRCNRPLNRIFILLGGAGYLVNLTLDFYALNIPWKEQFVTLFCFWKFLRDQFYLFSFHRWVWGIFYDRAIFLCFLFGFLLVFFINFGYRITALLLQLVEYIFKLSELIVYNNSFWVQQLFLRRVGVFSWHILSLTGNAFFIFASIFVGRKANLLIFLILSEFSLHQRNLVVKLLQLFEVKAGQVKRIL